MDDQNAKKLDDFIPTGGYFYYICIIWELLLLGQLSNMVYMVFAAASPLIIGCGTTTFPTNLTDDEACSSLASLNETCDVDVIEQFKSINVEFGYLCNDARYVKYSISVELAGAMAGAVLLGQISDRFGRKRTLIAAASGLSLLGCLSSFAQNLWCFMGIRFFVGFFNGGSTSVLTVFAFENLPQRCRFWLNTIFTWSPNFMILALIAYLSGDWRTLARAISALIIPAIVMLCFAYESPLWLIRKGQLREAEEVIIIMNKMASRKVREQFDASKLSKAIEETSFRAYGSTKNYYFYHLYTSPTLRKYALTLSFSLMTTSLVHFGLLFNLEKVSGSLYWNLAYTGIIRFLFNIAIGLVDKKYDWCGRKIIHLFSHSFVIATALAVILFHCLGQTKWFGSLLWILVVCGVSMCSELFIVNVLCAAELFPTEIRNAADSQLAIWNRMGTILAPQILLLRQYWSASPYVLMLSFCLVDVVLFHFFIPETKNKELVESMSAFERIVHKESPPESLLEN